MTDEHQQSSTSACARQKIKIKTHVSPDTHKNQTEKQNNVYFKLLKDFLL
jgi:hypothetical protein